MTIAAGTTFRLMPLMTMLPLLPSAPPCARWLSQSAESCPPAAGVKESKLNRGNNSTGLRDGKKDREDFVMQKLLKSLQKMGAGYGFFLGINQSESNQAWHVPLP